MGTTFDMGSALKDLQTELDEAKDFQRWNPPAGSFDCLFDKLVVITQEKDGVDFPVYKPYFRILEADDLDGDTFTRWFGFKPGKGRKFQLAELMALARAVNGGEEVATIPDAIDIITAASDSGDCIINVTVTHRVYGTNEDGSPKVAGNYTYRAVATAVAA